MQRTRILATAFALSLGLGAGLAQSRGGHGGGHGGGHWGHWGHWGLGLAIGLPLIYGLNRSTVVVQQAPPVVYTEPAPVAPAAPAVPPAPPEPIVYPSGGQSPAQTEADRQACHRWATTQPGALADASVFHRATLACLAGRGYTVR
ncbi:hypothetical protein HZ992_25140 [Rhizobacter sp. AJA081-3]|uniref:hypothetical protein n=1 Tax=Rhizobacter sp. AJA081-3 TaxID=2753607 RepID=UPI001ADEEDC9|nr:hypothetical protein [Rhizobacter sp. AJA081-3]QTN23351.1 hypothetical protein HZ992_25140 [Rhizobacter sp. AJA081-3]